MTQKRPYRLGTVRTLAQYEKQGRKCIYCYKKFEFYINHPNSPTLEHIEAQSVGGKNDPDNITLACHRCNVKRGNIPVDRFLDGYVYWTVTGRDQGNDELQSYVIEKKVRGPRRWYHKFIGYSI